MYKNIYVGYAVVILEKKKCNGQSVVMRKVQPSTKTDFHRETFLFWIYHKQRHCSSLISLKPDHREQFLFVRFKIRIRKIRKWNITAEGKNHSDLLSICFLISQSMLHWKLILCFFFIFSFLFFEVFNSSELTYNIILARGVQYSNFTLPHITCAHQSKCAP